MIREFAIIMVLLSICAAASDVGYVYEYKDVIFPVYKETFVEAKCSDTFNNSLMTVQKSCNKAYVDYEFLGFDVRKEPVRIIGYSVLGKDYMSDHVHIDRGSVSVWNIPIGQRDFKLFPGCRDYEIKKGVCRVVS
jgi:hypothetical protein